MDPGSALFETLLTSRSPRGGRLEADLMGKATTVVDGRVAVPTGPGLGVDPDPELVARYAT